MFFFLSELVGEQNVLSFGRDWDAGVNLLPPTVLNEEHISSVEAAFLNPQLWSSLADEHFVKIN